MRTAPVALAFLDDPAALAERARAISDVTVPVVGDGGDPARPRARVGVWPTLGHDLGPPPCLGVVRRRQVGRPAPDRGCGQHPADHQPARGREGEEQAVRLAGRLGHGGPRVTSACGCGRGATNLAPAGSRGDRPPRA